MMKKGLLLLLVVHNIGALTSNEANQLRARFNRIGIYNPAHPGQYNEAEAQKILTELGKSSTFRGWVKDLRIQQLASSLQRTKDLMTRRQAEALQTLRQANNQLRTQHKAEQTKATQLRQQSVGLQRQNEQLIQTMAQKDAEARHMQEASRQLNATLAAQVAETERLRQQLAQNTRRLQQQLQAQQTTAAQAQQEAEAKLQQDIAAVQQQLEGQIRANKTLSDERAAQAAEAERLRQQLAQNTRRLQQQLQAQQATATTRQQQAEAETLSRLQIMQSTQSAQNLKINELERQLVDQKTAAQATLQERQAEFDRRLNLSNKRNAELTEELGKFRSASAKGSFEQGKATLPPAPTQDDTKTVEILSQRLAEFERTNNALQTQLTQAQTKLEESVYARRGQEKLIDTLREQISQQTPVHTDPGKGKSKERSIESSTYGSRRADAKQAAATLLKKQPQERTLVGHPLFSTLDLDQGTPTLIRFGGKRYQLNNPANPALVKIDKSHLVDAPAGQTTDGAPMSEEQKKRYVSEKKKIEDTSSTLSQSLNHEQLQYMLKMASETDIKEEGLCGEEFKKNGTIILFATHGTWSNKAAFGGDIKTISTYNIFKFACQLADAKKMRVKVISVSWSGALSLPDRKAKARELANYCKKLWEIETANIKETWMIGHSHGCNVSAMAANHLFDETKRLVDVGILLACPALDVPRPLDFNITYAFYAQGDFTQAAGSAQGRYNLNRKLPWAQPESERKVYNIRVMLDGYDMDHVSIKWGVMPHLAKILTYIDTYYPTYYDLELNVENHPNSLPLIAIRHQEQKTITDGTALAENTRAREDFTKKYKRDMSTMGIQYISGVTWLFNLAREGLSAWKGEPEIGAEYLTELPSDKPGIPSSSSPPSGNSS